MIKSARTAWTSTTPGGSLRLFWLLSAAVHAGLLAGLAFLAPGDGAAPRTGLPVRLVRPAPAETPVIEKPKPAPMAAAPAAAPPQKIARPTTKPPAPRPFPPEPVVRKRSAPPVKKPQAPPREVAKAPPVPPRREVPAPPAPAPHTRTVSLPPSAPAPAISAEELRKRLERIVARIERAKDYPEGARLMGVEGTAVVTFHIRGDGRVTGLAIRRTSGHSLLDAATLEAVRRAQPFPYVPHALVLPVRYSLLDAER